MILALVTAVMSLVRTNLDVRDIQEWRRRTDDDRYTVKDAERDHVIQRKWDARQNDSISELCDELRRLQKQLGKIPTENCEPPK